MSSDKPASRHLVLREAAPGDQGANTLVGLRETHTISPLAKGRGTSPLFCLSYDLSLLETGACRGQTVEGGPRVAPCAQKVGRLASCLSSWLRIPACPALS